MKAVLKWMGGKSRQCDFIWDKCPPTFNDYWEPFVGGASFALHIYENSDATMHLSDINGDLISFYNALGRDPGLLNYLRKLEKLCKEIDSEEWRSEKYYELRKVFNESGSSLMRDGIFYFLNKTCFNGVMRYNASGGFNVPYGKRSFNVDEKGILEFREFVRDKRANFGVKPFWKIQPQAGDLVYLDPPFNPISETANFTGYHSTKWGVKQEARLRVCCDEWTEKGVHILMSNNSTAFIRSLFKGFHFYEQQVKKLVGAKSSWRNTVVEVLISNEKVLKSA